MLGEVGLEIIKHVKLERTDREILKKLIQKMKREENETSKSTATSLEDFLELYENSKLLLFKFFIIV